jgi:hypothetical protein
MFVLPALAAIDPTLVYFCGGSCENQAPEDTERREDDLDRGLVGVDVVWAITLRLGWT